jgi:hypothetical protein
MWLDPCDRSRIAREVGEMESGAAADVENVSVGPGREFSDRGPDQTFAIEGAVLDLVGAWVAPDVGAGPGTV